MHPLQDSLNEREQSILRLLAEGLSEITSIQLTKTLLPPPLTQ